MNEEDYAIVVGISGYRGLYPLHSTHGDAMCFYRWLTDEKGGALDEDNVELILSPEQMPVDHMDGKPVRTDIDRALRKFGARAGRRIGRRLYFYFAGHGLGPNYDEVVMLMANAAVGAFNANIGLKPYRSHFKNSGLFDDVVYILDCCRSSSPDTVGERPMFNESKKVRPPHVDDFLVLAALYGEKAYHPKERRTGKRRGILTEAVMEALRGEPRAVDGVGRITATSIREYVRERVPALAKDARLDQTPEVVLPNREFVFVEHVEPRLLRIRIVAPAGLGGELVVSGSDGMPEIDRRRAEEAVPTAAPWELDLLSNRKYVIVHVPTIRSAILDTREMSDGSVFNYPSHA